MTTDKARPILSICIPTFNRAELLDLMLRSIGPQIAEHSDQVELIVADNCSPDGTEAVVRRAQRVAPIRYHRHATNIGWTKNVFALTGDLAQGEYFWLLGDDDMLLKGKLKPILETVRTNADCDCFFVNHFFQEVVFRNRIIIEEDSRCVPEPSWCPSLEFANRPVARWEEMFSFINDKHCPQAFTFMGSFVFRREAWCARVGALELDKPTRHGLATFDDIFPHVKIWARAMMGRPAYWIGEPCVLMSQGAQEWSGLWPWIYVLRIGEALRLYEKLRMDAEQARRLRKSFLKEAVIPFRRLLRDRSVPGGGEFSLLRFIWENRRHPRELAEILELAAGDWVERFPRPVVRSLQFGKRTARRLVALCHGRG
jgi:glycosyltransferase involved in cell wall biosynthesis